MPDFLATKDWKTVLDMKEHKSVKKTGISETLDDYASAKKKDDLGRMVSALQRIVEKAGEVKAAQGKYPKIVAYLNDTIKSAKAEQQRLAPRMADLAEQEDGDNEDNTLGKALAKVRQLGPDNAWNFVLVPGKPSSGLVIKRKSLKKADTELAFEMRGKRSPFFTGRCYGEQGKFVFETEAQPVPGMAKAAKNAALLHAEMNIKVLVRGAGITLDSDTDIEPADEGGPTGPAPLTDEDHAEIFRTRIAQAGRAVDAFLQSPNVKVEGAADGIFGAFRRLREQIDADSQIDDGDKLQLLTLIKGHEQRLQHATAPAPEPSPASKYPDEAYWAKLAEAVMRLDETKRMDGWKRFRARIEEVVKQFDADQALVEPARGQVQAVIRKALAMVRDSVTQSVEMQGKVKKDGDDAFAQRFLAMERKYERVLNTQGLDPAQVQRLGAVFAQMRDSFRKGTLDKNNPGLVQLERALNLMNDRALVLQREESARKGQSEMHEALKPAMALLKKASVPVNLIKDPELIRGRAKNDPNLRALLEAMTAAVKTPGKQAAAALEAAARKMLEAVERERPEGKEDASVEDLALQTLKRAQFMAMTAEYEALGNPPWDPAKADRASELQAQLFFLESSLAQGNPNYGAPRLGGGESGASGSWWIERSEANKGDGTDPKAKKTYIFKPGSQEGATMGGLPKGSGVAREVLAKRLDEVMAGAGFDVGISPTTMATIDSSQLGSIDPKSGPQIGSMQQLAPNDDSFGSRIKDGTIEDFGRKVDKKSFDDVAVFDMIYANLDRHPFNMLYMTDPDTGKHKLVPIDQGTSLPDPDDLQVNRVNLFGANNIMANPALEVATQPLGPETLEALARLDPDRMVADMIRARDDMARRFPGAGDTISTAAIEAMGARVRFIKEAAQGVPVSDMFEMLALGAARIAKASPDDIPDLIETLKQELADAREGTRQAQEAKDALAAAGDGGGSNSVMDTLQHLGWAWQLPGKEFDNFVTANPKLVARVIKGGIVNPAAARERDRLLPLARAVNPRIDAMIANAKIDDQIGTLREAVNAGILRMPQGDAGALEAEFNQLGGQAVVDVIARELPSEVDDLPPVTGDALSEDDLLDGWGKRVLLLRQWQKLESIGGMAEVKRRGLALPRESKVYDVYRTLDEAILCDDAVDEVLDLDDNEIDRRAAERFRDLRQQTGDALGRLRGPDEIRKYGDQKTVAETTWNAGKAMAAITVMTRTLQNIQTRLPVEARLLDQVARTSREIEEAFANASDTVTVALTPHMARLRQLLVEADRDANGNKREAAEREFKARAETAEKGAESDLSKKTAARNQLKTRADAHDAMPWKDALAVRFASLDELFRIYDLGSGVESGLRFLGITLDSVDAIKAELGDRDLGALPDPVKAILSDWVERVKTNSKTDEGGKSAAEIRQLLAA